MSTVALSNANTQTSNTACPASENELKQHAWLIQGVNEEGIRFRPSDWAERLSSLIATFEGGRMQYSALLYPVMINGIKCLHLDERLLTTEPGIHMQVMEFVTTNQLNMVESL